MKKTICMKLDWMNYLFMHFDLKFAQALSKSTESLRSIKFVGGIRNWNICFFFVKTWLISKLKVKQKVMFFGLFYQNRPNTASSMRCRFISKWKQASWLCTIYTIIFFSENVVNVPVCNAMVLMQNVLNNVSFSISPECIIMNNIWSIKIKRMRWAQR